MNNYEPFIDSRDLIEYIENNPEDAAAIEFAAEFEDAAIDFDHGGFAIRDTYFTEYCRELLQDCGMIPENLPEFINNNINWEGVADEIQSDYSDIDFDGVTYWTR